MSFFGGRPITRTFTPAVSGVVEVSVIFDMWYAGFSGAFNTAAAFCEQGGVTTYGPRVGPQPDVLQSIRVLHQFAVVGGSEVTVGLAAYAGGVRRMEFGNLSLQADFYAGATLSAPPTPSPAPPAPPPGPTPSPPPEPPPPPPPEPPAPPPDTPPA